MTLTRSTRLRFAACASLFVAPTLALCPAALSAQTYPTKSIKIVVPLAAGGPTDTLARTISEKLAETWGQAVVIDNRPGANTNIGTEAVARAPADGYTLLLTVNNLTINPSVYSNLPFDPIKDFAPVSLIATSPLILVVNPALPVNSVRELIAFAKANPGKVLYGSPGNGSPPHLAGELFNTLGGVKLVHVPYKGITQAFTDLVGNHISLMFPGSPIALPQVRAGKIRALATTGQTRTAAAPDLPTMSEAGLPGCEVSLWYGILAPAGTSPATINQLQAEIVKIVGLPEVRERWAALGAEPVQTTPAEFAKFLRNDLTKWQSVVRESGAKNE